MRVAYIEGERVAYIEVQRTDSQFEASDYTIRYNDLLLIALLGGGGNMSVIKCIKELTYIKPLSCL